MPAPPHLAKYFAHAMAAPLPEDLLDSLDLAAEKAVDMVTAAEGLPDDALRGAGAAKVAELA